NRINASNPNNAGVVKTRLNDMMTQVCNNIKNAASGDDRVDIYTITFGNVSADTRTLYQNCATDPSFYYNAPTNADLVQAFQDIGNRINVLRYSWPGTP